MKMRLSRIFPRTSEKFGLRPAVQAAARGQLRSQNSRLHLLPLLRDEVLSISHFSFFFLFFLTSLNSFFFLKKHSEKTDDARPKNEQDQRKKGEGEQRHKEKLSPLPFELIIQNKSGAMRKAKTKAKAKSAKVRTGASAKKSRSHSPAARSSSCSGNRSIAFSTVSTAGWTTWKC